MTNLEIIVNAAYELNLVDEESAMQILESEDCPFHSFQEWKRLGFSVKKGEKALFKCALWNKAKVQDKDSKEEVEKFVKRFAYIFSKEQVEKTEVAKQKLAKAEKKEEVKEERKVFRKVNGKATAEVVGTVTEEDVKKYNKAKAQTQTKKTSKKASQPKAESKAKTVKATAKTVQPKAEKTIAKPKATQPKAEVVKTETKKNAGKKLAKAEKGKMTSYIKDGIEFVRIDLTKENGNNAWLVMRKDFFLNLPKKTVKEIYKKWALD